MKPRRAVCIASLLTLLLAVPAFAGTKKMATMTPLDLTMSGQQVIGGAELLGEACALGETREPAFAVQYLLPPNDQYYTLLTGTCSCGEGQQVVLTHAVLVVQWPAVACQQEISVSIVGATGGPECYQPDLSNVLCAPSSHLLDPPAPGGYFASVPLPEACAITGPAFLRVEFPSVGPTCSDATLPALGCAGQPCTDCHSYNFYPTNQQDDICNAPGWPAEAGNPIMYVETECVTASKASTWGQVKRLYR